MSTTISQTHPSRVAKTKPRSPYWQTALMWGAVLALIVVAIAMRLYNLDKLFDYDGYDEGVYWQTLRAMSAGYGLYGQIFYSQPPFFLLSVYPFFVLFGHTIWSARLGVAVVSLLGLPGAYLLGKSLSGRVGAIAAMLLLIVNPLYLAESQILQAEASSVAFSLLAVGAAYMWWKQPGGRKGIAMAILCGIALPLGILCKLLSITTIVPTGMLLLARLWQIWRKRPGATTGSLRSIVIAIAVCIVTALLVLLPFLGSYQALLQQVVAFHDTAKTVLISEQITNKTTLRLFLASNLLLVLTAAFGSVVALLRRDWRIIPLVAWFLVTFYVLWIQVPLFYRHAIALIPALIAMAVIGIGNIASIAEGTRAQGQGARFPRHVTPPTASIHRASTAPTGDAPSPLRTLNIAAPLIAIVLILIIAVSSIPQDYNHYRSLAQQGSSLSTQLEARIAHDLQNATKPGQLVITDGQFVAGLADRSTPPLLVDTSTVRITSGYLTLQQLISAASQPQVQAVLFFSSRLSEKPVAAFHTWVARHFHLLHRYGPGIELWVK